METMFCPKCTLIIPPGSEHATAEVCVEQLRLTLLRQKRATENIGYEVSVRFLAILEELALHPDAGVPYRTLAEGTQVEVVPPRRVSGVFAAILLRYRDVCDWSPLAEAREAARVAKLELAEAVHWLEWVATTEVLAEKTRAGIVDVLSRLWRPPARPPGPSGS